MVAAMPPPAISEAELPPMASGTRCGYQRFTKAGSIACTIAIPVPASNALAINEPLSLSNKRQKLAKVIAISLKILSEQSMVLLTNEFATREQIERYCRQHGIQPQVMMEANSLSAVIEIVRHTQLTTLLPSNIANNRDELVAIALAPSLLQRTAVLQY
ncbi:hypothetical protein SHLI107390_01800 [Shewanella livingstonensis]